MCESESMELWTPSSDSEESEYFGNQEKWYRCEHKGCFAVFNRPGRLANHVLAHEGKRQFQCDVAGCSKAYTTKSHLRRHSVISHSSQSRLNLNIPCPVPGCKKVLKTRDTLVKHVKRAHSERLFECKICSMSFRSEEQLNAHSRFRHNYQDSHRCEKCNLVFAKLRQYNRHMRRHRLHVCPHSDCYFTCEQYILLRRHLADMHPNLLKCYHCGKETKDKAVMRKHVRVHLANEGLADPAPTPSATSLFSCSLCTAVLSTKGSLKRHELTVHSSEPKTRKPVKKGVERAQRLDKGLPRRSTASRLASVNIPNSLNRQLLSKVEHSTDDATSSLILEFMLTGWLGTGVLSPDELLRSE